MKKLIKKRNKYLNSLFKDLNEDINEKDREQCIIKRTESLNVDKITKLLNNDENIEYKIEEMVSINNKILKNYIKYLNILGHKEEYLKQYKNNNNLINIKKYFENNIFISIVDFKNGKYKLYNRGEFSKHMYQNPKLIISPNNAKSDGYKIFLRNI
jgi:hypothetical protein